jgi:hypothetical protein
VGLARLKNPENYAGGSIATGRTSCVGQAEGDDADKKIYTQVLQHGELDMTPKTLFL